MCSLSVDEFLCESPDFITLNFADLEEISRRNLAVAGGVCGLTFRSHSSWEFTTSFKA